jgi:hypothetical protein
MNGPLGSLPPINAYELQEERRKARLLARAVEGAVRMSAYDKRQYVIYLDCVLGFGDYNFRANNPGDITYSDKIAAAVGAYVGTYIFDRSKPGAKLCIFPTWQAGFDGIFGLIRYQGWDRGTLRSLLGLRRTTAARRTPAIDRRSLLIEWSSASTGYERGWAPLK